MKLKTGLWIIGIVIVLAICVSFLPDENNENTITSDVIKEEVSEEIETQEQQDQTQGETYSSSQPEEDNQINTEIQPKSCGYGLLEEYRCNEADIEQKYQHSNCGFSWLFYDLCRYGCSNGKCNSEPEEQSNYFIVTRVIDGDTIELISGKRVRLICIDTPERNEYYYSEASNYLKDLILNEEVELIKDISETDRYGRLLRYIFLKDGSFVNELIVYNGFGKAYPYNPDTSLCPEIQSAEQHAKNNNLGIWKETIEQETSTSSNIICSYNAYNCGDFSTCSEVMEVFNYCSSDIHYLDGDDDGIPCESLCG